jgi:DNA replication and repair protein RecF
MKLNKLNLVDFRNYTKKLEFSEQLNLIIGPNTSGKTNLLESIYLLASGESFRATKIEEMIRWGKSLALVEGLVADVFLKIALQTEKDKVTKQFWVDDVEKKKSQFIREFSSVIFRPENIRMIRGSPSRRRNFLDDVWSSWSWEYYQPLLTFNKAIIRRNRVLRRIQERKAKKEELFFWSKTLEKNGEILRQKREQFLEFANYYWQNQRNEFSHLKVDYLASPITVDLLEECYQKDVDRGVTTIGPQRDDFRVISSEFGDQPKNVATWGSRGQQRLATLALKLAQLSFIEEQQDKKPVLLLDDIFSELDKANQELVVSLLPHYQTFLTLTEDISVPFQAKVIKLT